MSIYEQINNIENQIGLYDTEPDLYTFSFNGYSGKFVIDRFKRVHLIPEQDIIIQHSSATTFTLLTPDGSKYSFSTFGRSWTNKNPIKNVTAIYLTQIITPNLDVIDFEYEIESSVIKDFSGEYEYIRCIF